MAPQELAEEFRRLAAESQVKAFNALGDYSCGWWSARKDAFSEAAQMLEERLNGA